MSSVSVALGGAPVTARHGAVAAKSSAVTSISHRSLLLPSPPGLSCDSLFSESIPKRLIENRNSNSSLKTAVAAIDSDQLSPEKQQDNKYYFVVANAKFMLDEEEHFREVLFERLRYYGENNKELDFWLVIEPKFLEKFPNITQRLRRPAVALVSTNGPWITFMKLRLDRVLSGSYEANSLEEALDSNPATLDFQKPEKWLAPYPKYEYGWWEQFLATGLKESKV